MQDEVDHNTYQQIKSLDRSELTFFLSLLDDDFKELKRLIQIKIELLGAP